MLIYFLFILNTFKVYWNAFTLTKKLWKKNQKNKIFDHLYRFCEVSGTEGFQHHLSSGLLNWLTGLSRDELPIDHALFLSIFFFFRFTDVFFCFQSFWRWFAFTSSLPFPSCHTPVLTLSDQSFLSCSPANQSDFATYF